MEKKLKIQILNKEWEFKCAPSDQNKLQEAALSLDHKVKILQQEGRTTGYDHLILLAAVSLSHELIIEKNKTKKLNEISKKIEKLREKISSKTQQLDKIAML